MKHLGDITKINWLKIEPVDVVTGGSPCQDLSIAGKRAGLVGERSGLFMEQIRCVKELREADAQRGRTGNFCRPRFMVWENVAGAFSSGKPKGADFAAVIEEIIKIAEPDAVVRVLPPDKGWNKSGCYYSADGKWSVAWRLHDAQFWGVPQRRKRISLVADFGGLAAPEILFERKGVSRDFEQSDEARKETARAVGGGIERASESKVNYVVVGVDVYNQTLTGDVAASLTAACGGTNTSGAKILKSNICLDDQGGSQINVRTDGKVPTLRAEAHGNLPCIVETYDARGNGDGRTVCTLTGDHENRVTDYTALCFSNQAYDKWKEKEQSASLRASGGCYGGGFESILVQPNTVRRLTPLECERLQGYPDGWTDIGEWQDSSGKKRKEADSPRYKALGNSIALPFWKWLLKRISAQYERDATLGSLFDGIGGFPLCWEQINGKGSARWASEIEEFPIAVTKLRFGNE